MCRILYSRAFTSTKLPCKGENTLKSMGFQTLWNYFLSLTVERNKTEVMAEICAYSESGSGAEVIKLFSCSTQLSSKFILLINVKMPTIVGILTFISMIDTTSEKLKGQETS